MDFEPVDAVVSQIEFAHGNTEEVPRYGFRQIAAVVGVDLVHHIFSEIKLSRLQVYAVFIILLELVQRVIGVNILIVGSGAACACHGFAAGDYRGVSVETVVIFMTFQQLCFVGIVCGIEEVPPVIGRWVALYFGACPCVQGVEIVRKESGFCCPGSTVETNVLEGA